jgi:23S rRNA pseudouridine2605 synthase
MDSLVRLQKFLAEAGVASRRASERLILEGHVAVNGEVRAELGTKINPERDQVRVQGTPVRRPPRIYLALNKPKGVLCTRKDPQQRQTIQDFLPSHLHSLFTVGRLDCDSEGLIFLTNDGEFSLKLAHPRFGVRKLYLATIPGRVDGKSLSPLVSGIRIDNQSLKAERVRVVSSSRKQSVIELELAEGKYREVRRMLFSLGHEVTALRRTQIGPIKLGELKPGRWRILQPIEVKSLLRDIS